MIALSGRFGDTDVSAGREAGFTDYIQKFDRDILLSSLRCHLTKIPQLAA